MKTITITKSPGQMTAVLIAVLSFCLPGQAQENGARQSGYDQLVVSANSLLKQGKLDEAKQTIQQAIQQNGSGYLAYAVAARIASQQGASADAAAFIQKALQLAPDDGSKAKVQQLAAMLGQQHASPTPQPPATELSDDDRLTFNVLMRLLKDADDAEKAGNRAERVKAFQEFLRQSADFTKAHPEQSNLWEMRALAAIDLGLAHEGWEAGQHLKALGLMHGNDPKVNDLFVDLKLKDWLGERDPAEVEKERLADAQRKAAETARLQEVAQYVGTWRVSRAGLEDAGWIYGKNYNVSHAYLGKVDGSLVISTDSTLNLKVSGQYSFAINDADVGDRFLTGKITNAQVYILPSQLPYTDNSGAHIVQRHLTGSFEDSGSTGKMFGTAANFYIVNGYLNLIVLSDSATNGYHVPFERTTPQVSLDRLNPPPLAPGSSGQTTLAPPESKAKAQQPAKMPGIEKPAAPRDWSKFTTSQVKALAANGDAEAADALGSWYQNGLGGLARDYVEAVKWYRKAAEQGNAGAQVNLGRCYQNGWGLEKDLTEAAKWFRKGAEQGNVFGEDDSGLCYENGWGVEKNFTEAAKWYRKAAEQGNAGAQVNLGCCYQNGWGVEKDFTEAAKWFRKSAEQGNAFGEHDSGICYENGWGVEKNFTEAAKWYRKAAEQGDALGQVNLGCCYQKGWGVEKDFTEAAKWFRKSAEQGNAFGEHDSGLCYENGWGVEKDFAEAAKWYRKAAEQGDALGQINLGRCYQKGWGVEKDFTEAAKWFRKGAEQGNAFGEDDSGLCYENGWGVEKDFTEAAKWYRKAAEQGNALGQVHLGYCYQQGWGVEKNLTEAVNWYRKAAAQGNMFGENNLGACYEIGQGVDKDLTEAIGWYRKSASGGDLNAGASLRRLGVAN